MKLLMFHAPEFWFKTFDKAIPDAPDCKEEKSFRQAVVIFYQVEGEDVGREDGIVSKWVKNAKWIAGKFATRTVILHSFNHLSLSKAPPETAHRLAAQVRGRLERAGFSVFETPFGYLNEWKLHVSGESLAKVFKEI